jgi:hypothetical protein
MTKQKQEAQARAVVSLRQFAQPKDTLYTVMTHVSANGMSRRFKVLHVINGEIHDISYAVAEVLNWRKSKRGNEVVVSGCGMDMGYHLICSLSYALGYNNDEHGRLKGTPDGVTNCYGLNHKHI